MGQGAQYTLKEEAVFRTQGEAGHEKLRRRSGAHLFGGQQLAQFFDAGDVPVLEKDAAVIDDGGDGAHLEAQDLIDFRHLFNFRVDADYLEGRVQVAAQLPVLAVSQPEYLNFDHFA
jgi:hypothetical protein